MAEIMTIEEIKARFDSEWILIEDPETAENLEVKGGKVLWHDKDRDELYRRAQELQPRNWAVLYTGRVPDDMEIVL